MKLYKLIQDDSHKIHNELGIYEEITIGRDEIQDNLGSVIQTAISQVINAFWIDNTDSINPEIGEEVTSRKVMFSCHLSDFSDLPFPADVDPVLKLQSNERKYYAIVNGEKRYWDKIDPDHSFEDVLINLRK